MLQKGSGQKRERRQWHPTPVLLPGKSHGQRSLVGCSPWGREESDTTERLCFHFSVSCIGEGNGTPLQCSCKRIPGMVELPSMGSHRVGHDWSDLAAAAEETKAQVLNLRNMSSLSHPFTISCVTSLGFGFFPRHSLNTSQKPKVC